MSTTIQTTIQTTITTITKTTRPPIAAALSRPDTAVRQIRHQTGLAGE